MVVSQRAFALLIHTHQACVLGLEVNRTVTLHIRQVSARPDRPRPTRQRLVPPRHHMFAIARGPHSDPPSDGDDDAGSGSDDEDYSDDGG